MVSPERIEAQPRALESTDNIHNHTNHRDHELLHSLNKLSISTSSNHHSRGSASPSPRPLSNLKSKASFDRLSSASPTTRVPSRSPILSRADANGYAPSSPTSTSPLLRKKSSTSSLRSVSGITPSRAPSRRSSSTAFMSPTASRSPVNGPLPNIEIRKEKLPPTPASVANTYWQKELDLLHATAAECPAETIAVLHDACYGHRFSRPRTSKGTLNTIVERPERIQASVLGLSMAYVRLGDRHCEGKHPIHPDLDPKSLPSIPFRIHKTTRTLPITSLAVTNVHGTKWMEELKIMCDSAETKLASSSSELKRPDMDRGPNAETPPKLHEGDLYLCAESLNAFEGAMGAVCEAVDSVFSDSSHKRAFVAVRPPGHHCSASYPSGFCWVNNVHVGIMHGILNHGLTHAAIIDFDLHHGDGSQAITWAHNKRGLTKNAAAWKKTSIGYFSVHDINSYPCEWGDEDKVKNASLCIDNAHGQNIWNVHLHEWKSDVEFWKLYRSKYSILLEKTRSYLRLQTERFRSSGQVPKAAIFLSAGFDASEWEGAGMQRHKVNVPTEFYARLTRDVVKIASEEGLSVDGRVISVLEGGYSDRALYSGVLSHMSGLAGSGTVSSKDDGGLGYEISSRVSFSRRSTLNEEELKAWTQEFPYDPNWWSVPELDRLDAARALPSPEPQKPREFIVGNYSSPTQSSNAKMTDTAKARRTPSGLATTHTIISRAPTPPPPDVPWTNAALELSKLLIPNNRQVDSCKHAELVAEATKARKERQSAQEAANNAASEVPVQASRAPTRMSLRERKPVSYIDSDDEKSRRKTVGGATALASEKASARGAPPQNGSKHSRLPSRRLSAASTLSTMMPEGQAPSMPTLTIARPDTSQSVRPESSMSVRTTASALNVKKSRPAAPPRNPSAKTPGRPKKIKTAAPTAKPAVGQIGLADASHGSLPSSTSEKSPVIHGDGPSVAASQPSHSGTSEPVNDLDSITTGMKRIKINVLTKEQKEARQRAEAEKKAAAQKEAAQHTENTTERSKVGSFLQDHGLALSQVATPAESTMLTPNEAKQPPTAEPRDTTPVVWSPEEALIKNELFVGRLEAAGILPPTIVTPTDSDLSHIPSPSSSPVPPTPQPARDDDLFVQYQPDGPPPSGLPITGPIQILEPNTGTPAKAKSPTRATKMQSPNAKRTPLPSSPSRRGGHSFTATSNIPFSPTPTQVSRAISRDDIPVLPVPRHVVNPEEKQDNAREIPETPGRH
ncbi:hypothetical protein F5Y15DRAFT_205313 [Xylariaceae sp. FL0016]|nr:hypothetical protein F5Y15DRAFT_205313 [Xylariaceae sp. FL0016]